MNQQAAFQTRKTGPHRKNAASLLWHTAVRPIAEPESFLSREVGTLAVDFTSIPVRHHVQTNKQDAYSAFPMSVQRCPFGGACHSCPPQVQAKLKVGQPLDKYEQEAARVAEQIVRMPEPQVQRIRYSLYQENDEDEILQAKSKNSAGMSGADVDHPLIRNVLSSPGQPLDINTRSFMESRFGYDFSKVRVHTDARAAETAQAVSALAYTVGHDIVFGRGQYAMSTIEGQQLLSHELTHIIQQSTSNQTLPAHLKITEPSSREEQEAKAVVKTTMQGQWATVSGPYAPRIAREEAIDAGLVQDAGPHDADVSLPGGVPLQFACVLREQLPSGDLSNHVRYDLFGGGRVYLETFHMNIDWDGSDPLCACTCGEYRQFVRGHARVNNQVVRKRLYGDKYLEDRDFHEDADDQGQHPYGHRDILPQLAIDRFINPDNSQTGCSYRGRDEPFLTARPGDFVDWFLEFKGQSYDRCKAAQSIDPYGPIHTWWIRFNSQFPGTSSPGQVTPTTVTI